jgi:hypothetical protein
LLLAVLPFGSFGTTPDGDVGFAGKGFDVLDGLDVGFEGEEGFWGVVGEAAGGGIGAAGEGDGAGGFDGGNSLGALIRWPFSIQYVGGYGSTVVCTKIDQLCLPLSLYQVT